MDTKKIGKKSAKALRQQIMKSMLASFKIEGIIIAEDMALATLKKVELSLGKQNG